ncbi:MAG: glycosyltransferase [Prolixibacteraceae bacterium]|nr:glycosyltransferase [Prolixibacteraceae bacterium]
MSKIYIIELCNFEDYPTGGHLSFAKQMMSAFGEQMALIGYSTGSEPVKQWIKKEINGTYYDFFSVRKVRKTSNKPIIPSRLQGYFHLSRCKKELAFLKNENVFIQTPQVLFAINKWGIKNICFRSPGTVNMLISSRYWYAKYFSEIYEEILFSYLQKVNLVLASSDKKSIEDFCSRSKNKLQINQVVQFPTRINTDIFKPMDRELVRSKIDFELQRKLIVTTGRLGEKKGWKFMIDCFELFKASFPDSQFFFIGDGEDRSKIEKYIAEKELTNSVFLKGKQDPKAVAQYINASDIFIMGSYIEGWSTSLVEAIACAVPVCITNFSSATELVSEGINGFICESRQEFDFVENMKKSLIISKKDLIDKSNEINKYSTSRLKKDLLGYWNTESQVKGEEISKDK